MTTRHALLDAVRALLVEHLGPDFTVTDISDTADVAQGTFYNHFQDRDAAIVAAVTRDVDRHTTVAESMGFEGMDAVDAFAAMYGVNIHRALTHRRWHRFALAAYQMRAWPSPERPGPTHRLIVDGMADGSMSIGDADMGWALTRHLLLGLAERLVIDDQVDLRDTMSALFEATSTILGFDAARVPTLCDHVILGTEGVVWE